MNPLWSKVARELSPYVPGEQPRVADLVKLNSNENPFGPSPKALEAMNELGLAVRRKEEAEIEGRLMSPDQAITQEIVSRLADNRKAAAARETHGELRGAEKS